MQTINFLQGLPKTKVRLSTFWMTVAIVSVLGVCVLISLITQGIYFKNARVEKQAKAALSVRQAEFKKTAKRYPFLADDIPLVNKVLALDQQYQETKAALEEIRHKIVRIGFSNYMNTLASVTPQEVWLSQIQIDHASHGITLQGFAVNPDFVTTLMGRLYNQAPFAKTDFNLFYVQALKDHPYVKFSISNNALGIKEVQEGMYADANAAAGGAQ